MKAVVLEMIVEESKQNEKSRMSEITRVNPSLMTAVLSESNYYYNTLILA